MSLSEFDIINDYLSKIKQVIWEKKIKLEDYEVFYRGESSHHETTIPGVFKDDWLSKEHKLFRELELRYPNIFDNAKSTIDKLAIMQHHGLKTRLLDFTTNPLLALYMAVDKDDTTNICPTIKIVFVKKDAIKYYDSDTVSVFANFAKMDSKKIIQINKKELLWVVEKIFEYYEKDYEKLDKDGRIKDSELKKFEDDGKEVSKLLEILKNKYETNSINLTDLACISRKLQQDDPKYALAEGFCYAIRHIHYLLHLIKDEKPYFKDMIWVEHFDKSVVFVKPKHNSQRLINQAGLFALFGLNNGQKENFSLESAKNDTFEIEKFPLCDCIKNKKDLCTKKYISDTKQALGILGVTKDKVYPEIEHASKYIEEIFGKTNLESK